MNSKIKKMLLLELGILSLVLIIFIIIKVNLIYLLPSCLINKTFGILCPSCGGTRCIINLLQGNFLESFNNHPIFFVTAIYLIVINVIYIINAFKKREILTFLYPKVKFWIAFIVILLIYTVVRNIGY